MRNPYNLNPTGCGDAFALKIVPYAPVPPVPFFIRTYDLRYVESILCVNGRLIEDSVAEMIDLT